MARQTKKELLQENAKLQAKVKELNAYFRSNWQVIKTIKKED